MDAYISDIKLDFVHPMSTGDELYDRLHYDSKRSCNNLTDVINILLDRIEQLEERGK